MKDEIGQGWYETNGFFPDSVYRNHLYQTSYKTFRDAKIDDLCYLLWCLLKPLLKYDASNSPKYYANISPPSNMNTFVQTNLLTILEAMKPFLSTIEQNRNDIRYVYETIFADPEIITHMLYIIRKHGLSSEKILKLTVNAGTHEQKWLKNKINVNTKPFQCVLKALTPANMRKIIDKTLSSDSTNVKSENKYKGSKASGKRKGKGKKSKGKGKRKGKGKYIEKMNSLDITWDSETQDMFYHITCIRDLLNLMTDLKILITPAHLVLPTKYKTPKTNIQRCSNSKII